MKQTAVEYFYQRMYAKDITAVFEQAKEMEKEQSYSEEDMQKAFMEGHNIYGCVTDNIDEAKECFNEWFKQFKNK